MNSKADSLTLQVACTPASGTDIEPYQIWLGRRCVKVVSVLDRWLAPDHCYFKILDDNGEIYIIRHDAITNHWELTLFTCDRL